MKIKTHFGNTSIIQDWNPNKDCCDWNGVTCDDKGRVIYFYLSTFDDISGEIPEAIGDLPYLQLLGFTYLKNLRGVIPQSISNLKNLSYLDINSNNISGPIPSFLGQMKKLIRLDLSSNNLYGSIPPSLGNLPQLLTLSLGDNKLTGRIPDSFGNLRSPQHLGFVLELNDNLLSGKIPASLGRPSFNRVMLQGNSLHGDASFLLGRNKTSLNYLDLSRNSLEFDFSKVEIPRLENLYLNNNKIYGSFPAGFTELGHIFLNVSYNRLCGQIPVGGYLQKLDATAYFHNRCLCGAPLQPCR